MNIMLLLFIVALTAVISVRSNSIYSSLSEIDIRDFQITKCDSTRSDPLSIDNIRIKVGGNNHLQISGTLSASEDLVSPIKASVTLKKKTWIGWISLPCDDNMGSCDYSDLCSYGYPENRACPPDFVRNGIPCRCPLAKGNYTLPPTMVPYADDRSVLNGKYKGNVYITHYNERLACYNMNFSLQEK